MMKVFLTSLCNEDFRGVITGAGKIFAESLREQH